MTDHKPPKEGPYEEFYENGQLHQKGNFKNGKLEGLSETFRENGQEYNFSPRCYKEGEETDMSDCEN